MRIISRISVVATLLAGILSAQGCTELEIPTFDTATHYIHFKDDVKKETRFSFAVNPGVEEYTIQIPVTLIGMALEADTEYDISLVTEGDLATTASGKTYKISNHMFSKGVYEDFLGVTVYKTDELSEEKRITIKIGENNVFALGPQDYITKVIYISNIMSRPDWWTDEFNAAYLGEYSDIKYEHFIIATGVSDLSKMSNAEISSYVRAFVYYLRELDSKGTPLYEKDGVTKVLSTIRFTNV